MIVVRLSAPLSSTSTLGFRFFIDHNSATTSPRSLFYMRIHQLARIEVVSDSIPSTQLAVSRFGMLWISRISSHRSSKMRCAVTTRAPHRKTTSVGRDCLERMGQAISKNFAILVIIYVCYCFKFISHNPLREHNWYAGTHCIRVFLLGDKSASNVNQRASKLSILASRGDNIVA